MNMIEHDEAVVMNVGKRAREILSYLPPAVDPSPMLQELAHLHPNAEDIVLDCFFVFLFRGDWDTDYYIAMAMTLCQYNNAFVSAFETYFVEHCTIIQERGMRKTSAVKIAHLYANLIKENCLSWSLLAHLTMYEISTMSQSFRTFCKDFFEEITRMYCYYFLQKISDRAVQQSIEAVYPEKGKRDTQFFIDYFDSLGGLPWVRQNLRLQLESPPPQ